MARALRELIARRCPSAGGCLPQASFRHEHEYHIYLLPGWRSRRHILPRCEFAPCHGLVQRRILPGPSSLLRRGKRIRIPLNSQELWQVDREHERCIKNTYINERRRQRGILKKACAETSVSPLHLQHDVRREGVFRVVESDIQRRLSSSVFRKTNRFWIIMQEGDACARPRERGSRAGVGFPERSA
jgi:hypothetical protein